MPRLLLCSLVVCVLTVARVGGQDRTDTATPPAVPAAPAVLPAPAPASPAIDIDDLWRLLRHGSLTDADIAKAGRRFIVVAPSVGSKPSTGFSGGFSGNVAFFAGDSATTRISTITGGMKISEKGQKLSGSRIAIFTADDRWFIMLDNRMSWTSQSTYALGADAPLASGTNSRLDVLRLYETAYRKVRPDLFVGGGLNVSSHFNVRPGTTAAAAWDESAYAAYSEEHGLATDHQTSSGANVGFRYDTRDNGINPNRGALASATYRAFFANFLGGSSTWQEVSFDARTYKKISPEGRQKLAFWFLGDMVTGGTVPFWDLPYTSMDGRSARGYGEGRYRGEKLMYWETEYRATLTKNGLLGMVVFANLTTVGSVETGERLFKTYAPAAGFGFRVLLNKRSRTNLCTDWGWGKQGSRGFYLAIQEAF
jgi:Omp85 superfamily domain